MITFVRETQGLDFAGAIEWLADRFRIPLEYEEASPGDDEARSGVTGSFAAARPGGVLLRALPLGLAGGLARPRLPRRAAASARRSAASSGSGSRSAARRSRARRARRASRARSCARAGLTRQRGDDYFQRRLLFPLTDARGRVLGFQARQLHEDDPLPAKYVNTPESELFHKGSLALRARQGARRDREGGPRVRRRGQHRRDRAPPGRLRAGRRVDGHRAHRAAAEGARAADEAALARVRRRRRGRVGDAARDGARRLAGLRREGRCAAAGDRPGRRSRRVRGEAPDGALVRPAPHAARGDARRRPRCGHACRGGVPRLGAGLAREERGGALGERPLRDRSPSESRPAGRRAPPCPSRRSCLPWATASNATRWPGSSHTRAEAAARGTEAGALPQRGAPADAGLPGRRRAARRDGVGLLAELDARAESEAIDENVGPSSCSPSASARCGRICSEPTSRGRGRSRSRSCASARLRPTCESAPRCRTEAAPEGAAEPHRLHTASGGAPAALCSFG